MYWLLSRNSGLPKLIPHWPGTLYFSSRTGTECLFNLIFWRGFQTIGHKNKSTQTASCMACQLSTRNASENDCQELTVFVREVTYQSLTSGQKDAPVLSEQYLGEHHTHTSAPLTVDHWDNAGCWPEEQWHFCNRCGLHSKNRGSITFVDRRGFPRKKTAGVGWDGYKNGEWT